MCLRVLFVSLLHDLPLFNTEMTPRLSERTRKMEWDGSERLKRFR